MSSSSRSTSHPSPIDILNKLANKMPTRPRTSMTETTNEVNGRPGKASFQISDMDTLGSAEASSQHTLSQPGALDKSSKSSRCIRAETGTVVVDLTSDEPEQTTEIFEVEAIVGHEIVDGILLFRVRWKGCGPEDDTLEPYENVFDPENGCDSFPALDDYFVSRCNKEHFELIPYLPADVRRARQQRRAPSRRK